MRGDLKIATFIYVFIINLKPLPYIHELLLINTFHFTKLNMFISNMHL